MMETEVMIETVQQPELSVEEKFEEPKIVVDLEVSSSAPSTPTKDDKTEEDNLEPNEAEKEKLESNDETEVKSFEQMETNLESKDETEVKSFEQMEANLNEFIEQRNKPKRKTVAELLQSLPGYGNILDKKPTIRPTLKSEIDFDEDSSDFKIPKNDPKKKGIEDLIHRFKIHTAAGKPEKEQHFKIHIAKKEEDSQGINHIKVDEVDYVKVISTEEQEKQENTNSPHIPAPGVKMSQMKSKLLAEIRAKRAKQYEEKLKAHAMYSEEKDLDEKKEDEADEEEILDDEISDESEESDDEIDENQEEDIEALLDAKPKKKKNRKRLAFFEDEAEESDTGNQSADEDEDKLNRPEKDDLSFIDDRPISDDDDDDDIPDDNEINELLENDTQKSEYNVPSTQDFLFDTKSQDNLSLSSSMKVTNSDDIPSQDLFSEFENECNTQLTTSSQNSTLPSFLDPNKTPLLSASMLSRRSSHMCTPSSLMPRMNSDMALDYFCEDMSGVNNKTPTISDEVAKLVGTPGPNPSDIEDELEEICSGRFPSQQPDTPIESQEFNCDGFGTVDDLIASKTTTPIVTMSTPGQMMSDQSKNETPKITERNRIGSKRLNFQNVVDVPPVPTISVADLADDEDDDGVGHSIGNKIQKKRKRVLKFSDDEDSDASAGEGEEEEEMEMDENSRGVSEREEEDESDVESMKEYDENEEEIPKFKSILSNKTGKIRQEFVEDEAELSEENAGSADEDEGGLDELEIEAGDEEEIDEENLRNQVGKAHLKLLLDDDQREIRFLQDVYLEQGDLYSDGKGRERQFKWKNIDNYDPDEPLANNGEGVEIVEDETEAKRQRERIEKIKWMKEHSQVEDISAVVDPDEEGSQMFLQESQFLKLKDSTLRKIQSVSSFTVEGVDKAKATKMTTGLSKKGSFLQRELSTMSRLAEMTKINDSVVKVKNKLVFSVITPPSDASKSSDSKTKHYRKQQPPKKILKVDPAVNDADKSPITLFKWIK